MVISLFVVVTVLTVLTANLPASRLDSLLLTVDHPYLNGLYFSQNWGVFAPDPRQQSLDVYAQVAFADGTQRTWHIPARNAAVGEYIDYRWRKWEEWVSSPSYAFLYRPGAVYIARSLATPQERPIRVTLFDRTSPITLPGQPALPAPAAPQKIYTTPITPGMLSGADG